MWDWVNHEEQVTFWSDSSWWLLAVESFVHYLHCAHIVTIVHTVLSKKIPLVKKSFS